MGKVIVVPLERWHRNERVNAYQMQRAKGLIHKIQEDYKVGLITVQEAERRFQIVCERYHLQNLKTPA